MDVFPVIKEFLLYCWKMLFSWRYICVLKNCFCSYARSCETAERYKVFSFSFL